MAGIARQSPVSGSSLVLSQTSFFSVTRHSVPCFLLRTVSPTLGKCFSRMTSLWVSGMGASFLPARSDAERTRSSRFMVNRGAAHRNYAASSLGIFSNKSGHLSIEEQPYSYRPKAENRDFFPLGRERNRVI